MTDSIDNLTIPAPTPIPQTPSSQESVSKQDSSNEQITNEKVDLGETSPSSEAEVDYQIKCPEFIQQEEVKAHIEAFKGAGIDSKTAQKIVDRLVEHGLENEKRYVEQLGQSLEEDKKLLQKELGADFESRQRDISRYFHQENISDADVQSLVSTWGFKKTFHFFDRYAQMNKESHAGDTFAKREGSVGTREDFEKIFNSPGFITKLRDNDADANRIVRQWAEQQAHLNQ